MEKHSVSKLIGSPPGYVGYEEGGQLTERVKRSPYSIILLDEIEKAHPDIYNILLQVFEDGQLTDGLGNTVDFKNTIIIMTSNLGARFLEKRGHLGFSAPATEGIPAKVEDQVRGEVKRAFNPEFLNRLDEVILFTSLTDDDLIKIMDLLVEQINRNLVAKQIKIRLTTDAAKYILEKTCGDRSYGARPLRRALQKYIEDPLSEALIQGHCRGRRSWIFISAIPASTTGRFWKRSRWARGMCRQNRWRVRRCIRSRLAGHTPGLRSHISQSAATSVPFAAECNGSAAVRISDSAMGKSLARRAFSKRSWKPGGMAVPPLNTSGTGCLSLGSCAAFEKASCIDFTRVWITSS